MNIMSENIIEMRSLYVDVKKVIVQNININYYQTDLNNFIIFVSNVDQSIQLPSKTYNESINMKEII